jgi:hypothetical protein
MKSLGVNIPSREQLAQFRVNRPQQEGIYQPLYHYQSYAAAGTTTQYTFFQNPVGQSGLTYEDTNMDSAGQMPAGKQMLVTSIQVVLFPGADPAVFGAQAVAAFIDDVYIFGKAGYLKFFVGSKDYTIDGPMGKFSAQFGMSGFAAIADQSTIAADLQSRVTAASWRGPEYRITPVLLESNQNFNVTLNFPTTTAISAAARVGVILNGIQYRNSQ